MNTKLLRLARRDSRNIRYWTVPGYSNGARLAPSRHTLLDWGPAFYWPARDERGEMTRGVDLNRHRSMAKRYARELIKECQAMARSNRKRKNP
jgi:hypothetical protein